MQNPQWLHRTSGSMMQAPSSSPPRASGSGRWLAWARNAAAGSGAPTDGRAAAEPPACRAIDWRIIARSSSSFIDGDRIDDADDRRVHRGAFPAERLRRRPPFEHDEYLLVHARADAIHREQRVAAWRVVDVQRLHEHQLGAFELAMLGG